MGSTGPYVSDVLSSTNPKYFVHGRGTEANILQVPINKLLFIIRISFPVYIEIRKYVYHECFDFR